MAYFETFGWLRLVMEKSNRIVALVIFLSLSLLSCEKEQTELSKDANGSDGQVTKKKVDEIPETRQKVRALYIPLADHYAAIVAFDQSLPWADEVETQGLGPD